MFCDLQHQLNHQLVVSMNVELVSFTVILTSLSTVCSHSAHQNHISAEFRSVDALKVQFYLTVLQLLVTNHQLFSKVGSFQDVLRLLGFCVP